MDWYTRLLKSLPDQADVWADANRKYGEGTELAAHYAAGIFEGLYAIAKTALGGLLDNPKADAPATADELAGLEVPSLAEVDAPAAGGRAG